MQISNINQIIRLVVLLGIIAGSTLAFNVSARAGDIIAPELPAVCSGIKVPQENRAFLGVYALGVQVYRWNGSSWELVAPLANLYADEDFRWQVGIHYAGPTWEINNGSKVAAGRVAGCTPDPTAIPWLLLKTVSTDPPGKFKKVTYIQRVNTAGGLAPATPGAFIGAQVRVPYTAEYYFYRPE